MVNKIDYLESRIKVVEKEIKFLEKEGFSTDIIEEEKDHLELLISALNKLKGGN